MISIKTYDLRGRQTLNAWKPFNRHEYKYKIHGKRQPLDSVSYLPASVNNGTMLNLASWNSQLWPEVIDKWEADAIRDWHNHHIQTDDMCSYLEMLLGQTALNLYLLYKQKWLDELEKL